jgi:hypothetical protein
MRSVLSVLLLAAALNGCSDTLFPRDSIAGLWTRDVSVPGNSEQLNLSIDGSTVLGTGSFCGEAAPCGSLAVVGTISGNRVHLDITMTPVTPPTGPIVTTHFDGRLTSETVLSGSFADDTPATFRKVTLAANPVT